MKLIEKVGDNFVGILHPCHLKPFIEGFILEFADTQQDDTAASICECRICLPYRVRHSILAFLHFKSLI